ncbi:MAG TPA: LPS assembly lipoprotein LptE [Casimicrobiaceae bacterium]|jgi:LPS-assembly lipoprotein|nr:LPS assembly lipoprotein LptE [Casimicrobiaceae bacterium]
MSWSRLLAVALVALAGGCGFHLRGDVSYAFPTIQIRSPAPQPIVTELRRNLEGSAGTKVVDEAKDATVTLEIASVVDDKSVLSLSSGGRVSEYALTKRVSFNLRDKEGRDWIPAGEIVIRRSYTFNESEVLAREHEETRMLREMQTDAVQQIMRRLQAARKPLA